jgi:hypothetical protein
MLTLLASTTKWMQSCSPFAHSYNHGLPFFGFFLVRIPLAHAHAHPRVNNPSVHFGATAQPLFLSTSEAQSGNLAHMEADFCRG